VRVEGKNSALRRIFDEKLTEGQTFIEQMGILFQLNFVQLYGHFADHGNFPAYLYG